MAALPNEVTQLLINWSKGDKAAFDELVPLVHGELHRIARRYMAKENPNHTLQTSALINEAYIRLINQQDIPWQNRAHFFAVAAQVMRHILVDHARKYSYAKRGGGARKISLDDAMVRMDQKANEIVALDDALKTLAVMDLRKSQIVELRFIGGLSIEETAEVMGISSPTVQREWRSAKAWLKRELSKAED